MTRHLRVHLFATLLAAGLLATPTLASGQRATVTGAFKAYLTILNPPLTGAGVRPLDFGTVTPGTAKIINPGSGQLNDGEYRIAGLTFRASVDVTMSLPTSLTGPGGATMPISFNGQYVQSCEMNANACQAVTIQTWNPVTTPTYRVNAYRYINVLNFFLNDQLDISLGGVVAPVASQRAGRYTGVVNVLLMVN